MDFKWFLFRFEGRINRARYWLATLVILCSMIAALLLLAAICLVFGIPTGPLTINIIGISASLQLDDSDKAGLFPQLVTILMTLVFAWVYAAAAIKRLHDRNKSGWWMLPFVAAAGLYSQFGDRLGKSWAAVLIGLAVFVFFVWGLVEMYCLRGNPWPNRFGPDPLPKAQARSRGEQTALRTSSGWEQHSEIEFVPHSAGPSPGPHVKRKA